MKVILFGATGMVGASVLIECLDDERVESVLAVGRKASGVTHPKVRDLVHADLLDYADIRQQFRGFDSCFYCLGVSTVGQDEASYTRITYDITIAAATALAEVNPGMTFCFVSAAGADSTERGRVMWTRVKGKTENRLFTLPLNAYMFRPGLIQPRKGVRSRTAWYNMFYAIMAPIYPIVRPFAGAFMTTTEDLGKAIISVAAAGFDKRILESSDINRAAAGPAGVSRRVQF